MRKILLFFTILITTTTISLAQERLVTRGANSGELYLTTDWYGIYQPMGPPFYDTLYRSVFRLTENGKKLTIPYSLNLIGSYPIHEVMYPSIILADATPGVVYNKYSYISGSNRTQLWVSFDYGKNWLLREDSIGRRRFHVANVEGFIYRAGSDGTYKSENYGDFFSKIDIVSAGSEPGLLSGEAFSIGTYNSYQGRFLHTYNFYETYTEVPLDSQFVFGNVMGIFPDVYRGGKEGEVYVSSAFPDGTYRVSFSADIGQTFRHVHICYGFDCFLITGNGVEIATTFMSDREPGVFYIIKTYWVEDLNPWGFHKKICIMYYRDYGETLEATFCHNITKNYEYKEVNCDYATLLESNVNQNSIQLQWNCSANNSYIRGYHIYRNNMRITTQLLMESTYLDENLPNGNYEYYVRTYYVEGCVSDSSNHVRETIELGVKEIKELEGVILLPNPTTGKLQVQSSKFKVTSVEVFDVYGRKQKAESRKQNEIDISELQTGIYFVRLQTEKGITTKKIVKH
ncbi:MAG: T9SS type A sorting domain-containing protein [Bacteroidetes bacterium]|nr:T9SS type A sorting domain-containing protein [Bacteroidota bacterium]MCL2301882.1 T9SS type A sorting domain-containing protein [Lentimicrobiaceae bacterium]